MSIDNLESWNEGESFHDALYEWMGRMPWMAISLAAHLIIFLIIQAIPWNLFDDEVISILEMSPVAAVEPEIEDPPAEILPEELEVPETPEEPIFTDITDVVEQTDNDEEYEDNAGTSDFLGEAPFEAMSFNKMLGIGGGKGGLRGGRFGGDKNAGPRGRRSHQTLTRALQWLVEHQDADGKWDADEFMKHDPAGDECSGPGAPKHDVGLTGLALLALLGDGHTLSHGAYQANVLRAVSWLRDNQDFETGLIGDPIGHSYLYDHSIATLALCEAYYFGQSPLLRPTCQRAINLITRARNPYGAWRYDSPPTGDQDTSVTGWMVFALKSAQDGGLTIDEEAFTGARGWFDEVTDPATGRVGYDSMGSTSSRVVGVNDHFPPDRGEAMTATALLCRTFMGEDPQATPILRKHADLLARCLPEWDPDGGGCDMYYWYYGSYAMFQVGGRHWKAWSKALEPAVLDTQRRDGSATGSWDPVGPWGMTGGRVYSTALMALCLEVHFRYARIAGGR